MRVRCSPEEWCSPGEMLVNAFQIHREALQWAHTRRGAIKSGTTKRSETSRPLLFFKYKLQKKRKSLISASTAHWGHQVFESKILILKIEFSLFRSLARNFRGDWTSQIFKRILRLAVAHDLEKWRWPFGEVKVSANYFCSEQSSAPSSAQ